jgi:hypothetical protein
VPREHDVVNDLDQGRLFDRGGELEDRRLRRTGQIRDN